MSDNSPTIQRFVLHWGEMGVRWGINRSVGQVHGFLLFSPAPVAADEIADGLGIARSNVSTSLRELQAWGVVRVVHISGDRRDHFQAISDPWEMFRRIAAERKKRELDPTREMLHECLLELRRDKHPDEHQGKVLSEFLDCFDSVFAFYDQVQSLSNQNMKKFARLGSKILRLLGMRGGDS